MMDSLSSLLIAAGVASLLGAASLHAIVAALEQLPYAREQKLATRRRPDGRPTMVARIVADAEHTQNAASVGYAVLEPIAIVAWTVVAFWLGNRWDWSDLASTLVAIGVACFIDVLLVRALPRQLGRSAPESAVRLLSGFAWLLMVLTAPVRYIAPVLRRPPLAEASDLIEQAQNALEDDEAELLRSVVGLGGILVREVMVPRTDMVTIASGTTARKAMVLFMRSGFSRVPVARDGVDDLAGVVYLKDVVRVTWDDPKQLDKTVDEFMREPLFVPESLPIDDALRRMQDEVFHMAIVVDEFGGVAGLVTIEDAIEEIVGEVRDEHDSSAPAAVKLPDGSYRVPARFPLDELGELFDIEIEDDAVETVAGLLTKALGKVPIAGATASAHGLVLMAERTEGRRRRLSSIVVRREARDVDE